VGSPRQRAQLSMTSREKIVKLKSCGSVVYCAQFYVLLGPLALPCLGVHRRPRFFGAGSDVRSNHASTSDRLNRR
jgi:hypothetical protein